MASKHLVQQKVALTMTHKPGTLYLVPSSLGGECVDSIWPPHNTNIVSRLDVFIVENLRTARRFLRKIGFSRPFEEVTFHVLDKHSKTIDVSNFLEACQAGRSTGLLSEAGCPCIADPGQVIVEFAHEKGIRVVPLVGPSSILLALMASGFNGQNFAFHGYLPIDEKQKARKLKELERMASNMNQTQVFMETPFRNDKLLGSMVQLLHSKTRLCIATNLATPDEHVRSQTMAEWKKQMPDLNKKPSIFLLYKARDD